MKVIKSLENRGILLKGTTTKITSQKGGDVLKPLAESVLLPLGLSAGMSAADAAIQKKIYESGHPLDKASRTTALIISNDKIMKM